VGSDPPAEEKEKSMAVWTWILIAVGVLAVIGVALFAGDRRRSQRLQDKFGPEYEHTVAERGGRREAESELRDREQARDQLTIRPLSERSRERYQEQWEQVQSAFVDNPSGAVSQADRLVTEVMRERGYPVDDFDRQAAIVSVDHPDVVSNYREAHTIYTSFERGDASTEDLRQAMTHYRALFDELLSDVEQAQTDSAGRVSEQSR
jgi:hypothetical protein